MAKPDIAKRRPVPVPFQTFTGSFPGARFSRGSMLNSEDLIDIAYNMEALQITRAIDDKHNALAQPTNRVDGLALPK